MGAVERFVFDAVIADLAANRPTLLIVDGTPPGNVLHGFDYVRYFAQDARFRTFLSGYLELPPISGYRIFRRNHTG